MTTDKKMTMHIMPGAFDNFDGTQEELDALMNDINRMVEDGTIFENSQPVDLEAMLDEDPELALTIAKEIGLLDDLYDDDGNEITYEDLVAAMNLERNTRLN